MFDDKSWISSRISSSTAFDSILWHDKVRNKRATYTSVLISRLRIRYKPPTKQSLQGKYGRLCLAAASRTVTIGDPKTLPCDSWTSSQRSLVSTLFAKSRNSLSANIFFSTVCRLVAFPEGGASRTMSLNSGVESQVEVGWSTSNHRYITRLLKTFEEYILHYFLWRLSLCHRLSIRCCRDTTLR